MIRYWKEIYLKSSKVFVRKLLVFIIIIILEKGVKNRKKNLIYNTI